MRRPPPQLLVAVCLIGAAASGCGLGSGESPGGASILITRDFGAVEVGSTAVKQVPGGETVMRFLQRNFKVATRYGGGFVQSINGISGGRVGGRAFDWSYYINGIEAPSGAAATKLNDGDSVWWDHHDWGAAIHIPAVVGAFPEPFIHGRGGRRVPLRIECGEGSKAACDEVSARMSSAGAKPATAALGERSNLDILRILVGLWPDVRRDNATSQLDRGPGASGVFARFTADGKRLEILNPGGQVTETLGAGAGLVAATSIGEQAPTWIVTGTDDAGVLAAARMLTKTALAGHFALALALGGRHLRVPGGAG
ncbi:MAG: DUF4430 domain-containing protein [Actinomycetota bacterium]